MKKFMNKKVFAIVLAIAFIAIPIMTMATSDTNLGLTNANPGLGETNVKEIITNIINVILGFLGLIAVILILVGGFMWMTAGGNEEKITTGRKYIINGIIGIVIILAAFAIATFVITNIGTATGFGGTT